jgi:hypothetical protein
MEMQKLDIASDIFELVKNQSTDVKLDLISKISNSLKSIEKNKTEDSWKELFGAWESTKSAEEIIEDIRSSRKTDRNIEEL